MRFELTVPCGTPVFKTGAIDHSATPPIHKTIHFFSFIRYAQWVKYLGIDYGTKRIGVATSDDTGTLAFPLTTVEAGPKALSEVAALAQEHNVQSVVMGESRTLAGELNLVMENIEQFKKDLSELTGLPVVYEQEFFTSAQAARQGQDKRGAGGVEKSDASAAALILQGYLDRIK